MLSREINLHPSSDMLLKYSMGNTTEAESLMISCHIAKKKIKNGKRKRGGKLRNAI